jgi:hypothetical protein
VRVPRLTALLLLDRLDRKEGKDGISETLIAELRGAGLRKPVLLFAPPIKLESAGPSSKAVGSMSGGNLERLWVDVGFWVTPQGRVSELEILRSSGPTHWAEPVIKSIAGRLYSPAADGVMDGTYRIERYTYTAFLQAATGTRLRQRSSNARVEYLDLTAEPEARRN